jgi:hypothetical protein
VVRILDRIRPSNDGNSHLIEMDVVGRAIEASELCSLQLASRRPATNRRC